MNQAPKTESPVDYYDVLQVPAKASTDEIRISFKKLVLEFHPDKNPQRRDWSERRIRELIEAYDVLGDEEKRQAFDRRRRLSAKAKVGKVTEPFYYRKTGPGSRALKILHLLLNNNAGEASTLLTEMEEEHGSDFLLEYLEKRDYLDCLFLLAEYHVAQKNYLEAVERLNAFYQLERSTKFRRHYFSEVLRLLKDLYLRKLPRVLSPHRALPYLKEATHLQLSAQENLLRLRKVAECQARVGDRRGARQTLSQIQNLDPNAKGLDRIEALLAAG